MATKTKTKVKEEDTDALMKEADKEGSTRRRACPECGILNPVSRATCEVCGEPMYSPENIQKEKEKELWELNKRLRNAITAEDNKLIGKIRLVIAKKVAQMPTGTFDTDSVGYAKQIKATAKKAKAPAGKPTHVCPCCGEETARGSYFKQGHDGRAHGILKKVLNGKLKVKDLDAPMQRLYQVWRKSEYTASMRECAIAIEK